MPVANGMCAVQQIKQTHERHVLFDMQWFEHFFTNYHPPQQYNMMYDLCTYRTYQCVNIEFV